MHILLFDSDDIEPLRDSELKYYGNLKSSTYNDLEKLRKEIEITMSIWRSLTNLWMYIDSISTSLASTMLW